MQITKEKIRSMLYGLAVADAVGVPVEFKSREELKLNPIRDMEDGTKGTYSMPEGTWSDDTSMTLCLMESLGRLGKIDYDDIMTNFDRWAEGGEFTATGETFDIGCCCSKAIMRYMNENMSPLACGGIGESDNGNGSLMRISPMGIWLVCHPTKSMDESMELVHQVSMLTHAHPKSKLACGLYILIILYILQGRSIKDAIHTGLTHGMEYYIKKSEFKQELKSYRRLMASNFSSLPEKGIKSSGYVVDTLEAAIWCLLNTNSYEKCILKAVNLGSDTDTTAAVSGAIAGLSYGLEGIPKAWVEKLKNKNLLDKIAYSMAKVCNAV